MISKEEFEKQVREDARRPFIMYLGPDMVDHIDKVFKEHHGAQIKDTPRRNKYGSNGR